MKPNPALEQLNAAFDKLYKQGRLRDAVKLSHDVLRDVLFQVALNSGMSPSDADDATQETFLGLWKNLERKKYKPRKNVAVYIFSIAKKQRANHGRKKKKKGREDTLSDNITSDDDIENIVNTKQFLSHVQECVARLLPEEQQELAEYLDPDRKSPSSPKQRQRVCTARKKLRKCLKTKGVEITNKEGNDA